jgi:hypothetical protein
MTRIGGACMARSLTRREGSGPSSRPPASIPAAAPGPSVGAVHTHTHPRPGLGDPRADGPPEVVHRRVGAHRTGCVGGSGWQWTSPTPRMPSSSMSRRRVCGAALASRLTAPRCRAPLVNRREANVRVLGALRLVSAGAFPVTGAHARLEGG